MNWQKVFLGLIFLLLLFHLFPDFSYNLLKDKSNVFLEVPKGEMKINSSFDDEFIFYLNQDGYLYIYPNQINNKTYIPTEVYLNFNNQNLLWSGIKYNVDEYYIYIEAQKSNPKNITLDVTYYNKDDSSERLRVKNTFIFNEIEYYDNNLISIITLLFFISFSTILFSILTLFFIFTEQDKKERKIFFDIVYSVHLGCLVVILISYLAIFLYKINFPSNQKFILLILILYFLIIFGILIPIIFYNKIFMEKKERINYVPYLIVIFIYLIITINNIFLKGYKFPIGIILSILIIGLIGFVLEKNDGIKIRVINLIKRNKTWILAILGFLLFWQFINPIFSPVLEDYSEVTEYYVYSDDSNRFMENKIVNLKITPAILPITVGPYTSNKLTFNYNKNPTVIQNPTINSRVNKQFFVRDAKISTNEITLFFKDDIQSEKLNLEFTYDTSRQFYTIGFEHFPLEIEESKFNNSHFFLVKNIANVPVADYHLRYSGGKNICNCTYIESDVFFNTEGYINDGVYCEIGSFEPGQIKKIEIIC